ncbi:hypothetical protein ACFZBZ_45225 [Streptomyces sp. NPDC008196]|uniref:hypothetical protein n=1 Tax=Streptomyces sp. NPDC008196 TaxID=3364819 RepID=UPI0036E06AE0
MTTVTRCRLSLVPVRVRRGTAWPDKPVVLHHSATGAIVEYDPERACLETATMLTRVGLRLRGYTLGEILLEDHDPQLTALYGACSRLHLEVEHTTGPRITEPTVVNREDDWAYLVPQRWDLADALQRLPAAFAAARPDIARELERLEEAKRTTQGTINQAIDLTASLIAQTGDVQGVYYDLVRLLDRPDLPAATAASRDT